MRNGFGHLFLFLYASRSLSAAYSRRLFPTNNVALAVKRSRGVKLGCPEALAGHVPAILKRRAEDASLGTIRRGLRAAGINVSLPVISKTRTGRTV
jgi:hypothetical protein